MESTLTGIRGPILTFTADPFIQAAQDCYMHIHDGLIVIRDGHIIDVGPYGETLLRHDSISNIDAYTDALIMPGFIDCHTHYVQTPMVGSYGDTLLGWLNRYTFPAEARFSDKSFADKVAEIFFKQILSHGTTTANVFATTFETSVDAFFEESERYGTRMISGKVLQDRNLPDNLKDQSAEASIKTSLKLIEKWHCRGRQLYAITPRFAPTSSPDQLRLAGDLYRSYIDQGVYLHTHLDESRDEISWVASLFTDARNYTDVYRHFGLLGRNTVLAHCCIVSEDEWRTIHSMGCGIAHCPSSNLFLGDGLFNYSAAKSHLHPCRVGIGTDIGGGTAFSLPRQLGDAYKTAMINGHSLDALKSYYLATRGGAEALRLDDTIGSIAPGYEADITVLDLSPSEFVEWRLQFANDIFDRLFVLQTIAPDNMVKATYVAGHKVFDRTSSQMFVKRNT